MSTIEKKQSSRILTLDLMRGYFLFCIVIDHLDFWPNGLDWVSARGQLFISAAEGFFLISGIVLGIVRGSKLMDKPFRLPAWLLVKRGLQLYATYVILALFFTLVGWAFFMQNPGLKDGIAAVGTPLLSLLWDTLTLKYIYGWADYLRLYAMFLFVSPLVLWLLRKGKWWIALTLSIAVWAFTPSPIYPESLAIQPLKWQILFFGGMMIGFHWKQLTQLWQRISIMWRRGIVTILLSISALTLLGNIFLAFGGYSSNDVYNFVAPIRETLQHHYFDKELLMPLRLVIALLWFFSGFWLVHRYEKYIVRFLGWILLPFGTNSLYVYTVHAFIIFFVHLIIPPGSKDFLPNFLFTWGALSFIWVMIRYQILFKIIPR